MSRDSVLSDPGLWAYLGLGSALDGITRVTREASLRDKSEGRPQVMSQVWPHS